MGGPIGWSHRVVLTAAWRRCWGGGEPVRGWALLTVPCFSCSRFIPPITLAITSRQTPLHRSAPLRGLQVGEKRCSVCKGGCQVCFLEVQGSVLPKSAPNPH